MIIHINKKKEEKLLFYKHNNVYNIINFQVLQDNKVIN